MTTPSPGVERLAFWLLTASLGMTLFNLLAAQALFGLAAVLWLPVAIAQARRPDVPRFFWPLSTYAGLTMISAAMSPDPLTSLIDGKQLVLFLMVPIVMRLAQGERAMSALNVIMALGAAGAVVGVVEYTMFGFDNLGRRPTGSLTHYMTYGGVIMLTLSAAVARLLFYPAERVWPAIAVPALTVALFATQARNAWIGAGAAVTALLAARRLRLVLIMPVIVALALVVAPANIRSRAFSIVDGRDPASRDRLAMLEMGRDMVRDHPWFGVGPDMVKVVYPQYRPAHAVNPTNPHLHNVPVQIAAERGLPALGAWLIFIAVATVDLLRQLRRGPARALAASGLAAIVAMLAAGLFEYNFGDSEFLMLFLALITLPFAARLPAGDGHRVRAAARPQAAGR